tara:strand:+ start:311 stop:721 length:411 start_codon:yes stop_codon:yes gene_type:complete
MDKNKDAYAKALENSIETKSKDEKTKVIISNESLSRLLEVKKYMEWNIDISINAALTLFYNKRMNFSDDEKSQTEVEYNKNTISNDSCETVEFSTSVKNESRIVNLSNKEPEVLGYMVSEGILLLHKSLIGEVTNE